MHIRPYAVSVLVSSWAHDISSSHVSQAAPLDSNRQSGVLLSFERGVRQNVGIIHLRPMVQSGDKYWEREPPAFP